MRSVSSALRVRTTRSATQFAHGHRGGIQTTRIPTSARTASTDAVNWLALSQTRKPELGDAIAKIYHEVADLLGGPPAVGVDGRAQEMHGLVADLQNEEHLNPLKRDWAVHREEVADQHRRRLSMQELAPGRGGVSDRRRGSPPPPQDAANRRHPHAVTEFEQLAVDSLVSPVVILSGSALDQRGHRVINGRTPDARGRRGIRPLPWRPGDDASAGSPTPRGLAARSLPAARRPVRRATGRWSAL
jgi:hypothetical protein